jgi:hypothetical protein
MSEQDPRSDSFGGLSLREWLRDVSQAGRDVSNEVKKIAEAVHALDKSMVGIVERQVGLDRRITSIEEEIQRRSALVDVATDLERRVKLLEARGPVALEVETAPGGEQRLTIKERMLSDRAVMWVVGGVIVLALILLLTGEAGMRLVEAIGTAAGNSGPLDE